MSADNMLILLTAPAGNGRKEFHILEVRFSGFGHAYWSKGELSDELLVEIACARKIGRFSDMNAAVLRVERYVSETLVEYGSTSYTLKFPYPTEDELKAALMRWEDSRPLREAKDGVAYAQFNLSNLLDTRIPEAEKMLAGLAGELENPEMAEWHKLIREQDIPEAREKLALLRASVPALQALLQDARMELALLENSNMEKKGS